MTKEGQKGPFSLEQLPEAGVTPSTYVWCEGMADWEKADEVAEICRFYRNRLYDIMHPSRDVEEPAGENSAQETGNLPATIDPGKPTSRFDHFLKDTPEQQLPTIEEIEERENKSVPPSSMIGYAWIVTLFCCPPTGIAALVYAYRSKTAWKHGQNELAHDYSRYAKMWVGVSFFVGIILYAFLFRFL